MRINRLGGEAANQNWLYCAITAPRSGKRSTKLRVQKKSYKTEQDDRVQIWVCNESRAFNIHFDIANPRLCHRLKRLNDERQNHSRTPPTVQSDRGCPIGVLSRSLGALAKLSETQRRGSRRVNALWALAPRAVASGASERRFRLKHNGGGDASSQCECDRDVNQSLFHVPTPGLKANVR